MEKAKRERESQFRFQDKGVKGVKVGVRVKVGAAGQRGGVQLSISAAPTLPMNHYGNQPEPPPPPLNGCNCTPGCVSCTSVLRLVYSVQPLSQSNVNIRQCVCWRYNPEQCRPALFYYIQQKPRHIFARSKPPRLISSPLYLTQGLTPPPLPRPNSKSPSFHGRQTS